MEQLATIDITVIVLYLAGIMLFGFMLRTRIHTDTDFFLGGRNLPWWAIGMSMVVTDIGALELVGLAGAAYLYGIAVANFDWIGCIPAMIIGAFVFIPLYWRSGIFTIPEFLGRRYNQFVRVMVAMIWGVFFAFLLGMFFYTAGRMLHNFVGWPLYTSVVIIAIVVGVYTFFGGLSAVVFTDAVQCVILFAGSLLVLIFSLIRIGGPEAIISAFSALGEQHSHHMSLIVPADTHSPYSWPGILFGLAFVLSPAYWLGNQSIIQRNLGARSEYDAKKSVLFAAFLKLFIPIVLVAPGLIGLMLYPDMERVDDIYPVLVHNLLPPGITGIVFAAFLAALMSSVDSYLNSAATLWTKDIYQKFIRPDGTDRHYLAVGRAVTVVFLMTGVMLAPLAERYESIFSYFQTLLSVFQGPLLAILVLGLLWRRANSAGAITGLFAGISTSLMLLWIQDDVFSAADPFLYIAWWSFVVSLAATIIVSMLTGGGKTAFAAASFHTQGKDAL